MRRTESRLAPVSLVLVLAAGFAATATSVWDVDFFWHAASGRWIVENRSLPETDPFGLYRAEDLRSRVALKYSWLAQVALYEVLRHLGLRGIILFKASLLTASLWLVYRRARIGGSDALTALVVVGLCAVSARHFTGERPQLFSFLLSTGVFWLLDGYRRFGGRWRLALVPMVMAVWANCHGGVALGGLLLLVGAAALVAESRFGRDPARRAPWPALAVLALAIAATLLSPTGADLYRAALVLEGSEIQARTSEYLSPLQLAARLGIRLPDFWLLAGLALVALIRHATRRRIWESIFLLLLLVLALEAYRYIPFFVLVTGPYVASGLEGLMRPRRGWITLAGNAAVGIVAAATLTLGVARGRVLQSGYLPGRFPERAVSWLAEQGVRGKIFSSVEWGGFLLWHLYPGVRPFIDGRTIFFAENESSTPAPDRSVFEKYTHILWATERGQRLLRSEGFDLALVPLRNQVTGEAYPLNDHLRESGEWRLLFADETSRLWCRVRDLRGAPSGPCAGEAA